MRWARFFPASPGRPEGAFCHRTALPFEAPTALLTRRGATAPTRDDFPGTEPCDAASGPAAIDEVAAPPAADAVAAPPILGPDPDPDANEAPAPAAEPPPTWRTPHPSPPGPNPHQTQSQAPDPPAPGPHRPSPTTAALPATHCPRSQQAPPTPPLPARPPAANECLPCPLPVAVARPLAAQTPKGVAPRPAPALKPRAKSATGFTPPAGAANP